MHCNRMLVMCRIAAISCLYCPSIRHEVNLTTVLYNHRLYGNTQTVTNQFAITGLSVVWHLWFLMHVTPYAVSDKFTYDSVSVSGAMCLYCMADITYAMTVNSHSDSLVQRLLGNFQQFVDFPRDISYTKRIA